MRDSVYRISLDIYNETPQVQIVARQGDKARRIFMALQEHGKPWAHILDGRTRAVLTVVTPQGIPVMSECDIRSDGTVVYDFIEPITEYVGVEECELQVYDDDNGNLCSPRFTIVVVENAFDEGQIGENAWKKALKEVKDELEAKIDANEAALEKAARNYATVAEMIADAENVKVGSVCSTDGRWAKNDGGGRTYTVTDAEGATITTLNTINQRHIKSTGIHPLAIEIGDDLYAIPLIKDNTVTVFDLGLQRGLLRPDETDADPDVRKWEDGAIPAENSRLLQYFMNHMPEGFAKIVTGDTTQTVSWEPCETGEYGAYPLKLFFPAGNWYFRDPVIIKHAVQLFGVAYSTTLDQNAVDPTSPASRLIYLARELTVAEGAGQSVYPYVCTDAAGNPVSNYHVAVQSAENTGDQPIVNGVRLHPSEKVSESVFIDTYLFYIASRTVSMKDLIIRAEGAFGWGNAKILVNGELTEIPHLGYCPGEETNDKTRMGGRFNPYRVDRHLKGINGVFCIEPRVNEDGLITVNATSKLVRGYKAEFVRGSGVYYPIPYYNTFDRCCFMGFSGTALVIASLNRVNDCRFNENFVAIRNEGHDCWIHRIYADEGFIGVNTNWHTTYLDDCYIDLMAGFGVVSGYRIDKKSNMFPDKEPQWDYEKVSLIGALHGSYDCTMDLCNMGGYGAAKIDCNVLISGKIFRCGQLYDSRYVKIAKQDDFNSMLNYLKAEDALRGHVSENVAWDPVLLKWAATPGQGDETLTAYKASAAGQKYMEMYQTYKSADIQLAATTAEFLQNTFPDGMTEDERTEAIAEEIETDEELQAQVLAWLMDLNNTLTGSYPNGRPDEIEAYTPEDQQAAQQAILAELADYDLRAWWNRTDNFHKLVGTSAINILNIDCLSVTALISPRLSGGYTYTSDGVTRKCYKVSPTYGINCGMAVNSACFGLAQNQNTTDLGGERYATRLIPISAQSIMKMSFYGSTPPYLSERHYSFYMPKPNFTPAEFYILQPDQNANDINYKRLYIRIRDADDGDLRVRYDGAVSIAEGESYVNTTPLPKYVKDAGSDTTWVNSGESINATLPEQRYGSQHTDVEFFSFTGILIAAENYNDTVKIGEPVGTLNVNIKTGVITAFGMKDYAGYVMPLKLN